MERLVNPNDIHSRFHIHSERNVFFFVKLSKFIMGNNNNRNNNSELRKVSHGSFVLKTSETLKQKYQLFSL